MNVCLVSTEILGWGKNAGGFGFATRSLARELVARGVTVSIVIPQPRGTAESTVTLDGLLVQTYPRLNPAAGIELLRAADADIYHSQEPSLGTWLAQRARPKRSHVVTSRDPRLAADWWIEFRSPTYQGFQVLCTALYYDNPLSHRAVRRARAVYVPARFLAERVRHKYRLGYLPEFLPTPVRFPTEVRKAERPTVCFVGRLDRRKRPERFFELARRFPAVDFVVAGVAQDPRFAAELATHQAGLANLDRRGFVDQFETSELSEILARSWILVNTSAREGLPNSFIEACGHRCALLASVDPDGFVSRFGRWVPDGDFAAGLRDLLDGDRWRRAGEAGYRYVKANHAAGVAVERHLDRYRALARC
ncbi:MAG TPA: glycosyltransferase family 4 protein [Xanthomonadaceae bacterium]|nr:glycosyltransferase family 4 protein [Xanthomonadaceae bacterium]